MQPSVATTLLHTGIGRTRATVPLRYPVAVLFSALLLVAAGSPPRALGDGCRHADVVFYTTDSQRLAQRLHANPSPCADYFVSVTPMTDLLTPRAIAAAIRANGPQFHAIAEVRPIAWASWVAANGKTWFDAGVEARARMTTAGYDTASGDTWAVNDLRSDVLSNTGTARADFREFLRGLYTGDGTPAPGVVFVADPMHVTSDLAQYKQQLEDFFIDTPFWNDMGRYVRFWGQEVYADSRLWGVAGTDVATRREYLNDYLEHALKLAEAGPGSAAAARSFLEHVYTPLANAAWPRTVDTGYGDTNVTATVMEGFIASQTDAMRTYSARTAPEATDHFGFAWVPKTTQPIPPAATYVELLDHLAAALHGSESDPAGACAASACDGALDGASFSEAWKAFASWSPPTNTPEGVAVRVQPTDGISVTFASVTSRGSTQTTASASGPPPPAGLGLQAGSLYHDVTTTSDYAGPVDVCIGYDGADFTGLAPRLFHLASGAWSDVTTTLDVSSHSVCGRVTSLSPFVVFGDEPPAVSVPADIAADATAPSGAIVDFSASATDGADPAPALTCAPVPATTFPIGDSTVTCTASDHAGNVAAGTFLVHVRGAAEQLDRLIALVRGAGLNKRLADDLLRRLDRAVTDLVRPTKCAHDLDGFVARTFKELGKDHSSLTLTTADPLLAATTVQQALGQLDPDSPIPLAEHDTLGLLDAVNGMSLTPLYANEIRERATDIGVVLGHGRITKAGVALDGLARKIARDTGRNGKLTAAQAATLSTAVAQIDSDLGL